MDIPELVWIGSLAAIEITSIAIVIFLPFAGFILTRLLSNNPTTISFVGIISACLSIPWYVAAFIVLFTKGTSVAYLFEVMLVILQM